MSQRPFRFVHSGDFHLEMPLQGVAEVPKHLREPFLDAAYDAARRVFDRAMNEGRGDLDFAAVAETVRGLRTEARTRGPGGPPDPLAGSTGEGTG